ncbi:hypothetical protein V8B97DRAFT_2020558 [Scleroderma yunnanense]
MDTSIRDTSDCKATLVAVQLSLLALSKISIMILGSKMHLRIDDIKKHITQYFGLLSFASTAWMIWTRCFELIMDATLVNHVLTRYLRGKQDTLTTNERNVYYEIHLRNQKDLTSCNLFFWLVVWVRWVEHVQLGQAMVDGDYIFPAIGANGVLKPCKPLSQDAVQEWISEATMGTGIEGTFTTHCFHQGGAQYWFILCLQHNMLICYLLDELHSYKNDHSDTLGPFSCEADMSLAGEHALAAPATREELQMFQLSVSTEICKLNNNIQAILRNVTNSLQDLTQNFATHSSTPLVILALRTNHISPHYMFPQLPAVLPSLVTTESNTLTYSSPSPFIPSVPFTHMDGMTTPRNKAWRDVIHKAK